MACRQAQPKPNRPAAETHTPWSRTMTGYFSTLTLVRHRECWPIFDRCAPAGGANLEAHHDRRSIVDAHAVEFSKTAKPRRKCFLQRSPIRPGARRRLRADPRV